MTIWNRPTPAPVTPAPTRTTGAMKRFTVMFAAKDRKVAA